MWIENRIFKEDLAYITNQNYIPWEKLTNKTILLTGATGLIGFNIAGALSYAALYKNIPVKILALVRDVQTAKNRFYDMLNAGSPIQLVEGDLNSLPLFHQNIDYIIHGGSPTASRYFAEYPVETIRTNLKGAEQLLEVAKNQKVAGFLFLSSMEVYGGLHRHEKVTEEHEIFVDTMRPRSCYPEAKRMVETMCTSYAEEYGVPAKVIRLTQTFGAGIRKNENRVFAQFLHSALNNQDIVMFTKGGSEHSYLYTADAVTAILTALLKGEIGEAYNAANESSYCSIKEMAELVADLNFNGNRENKPVRVIVDESHNNEKIYPPELFMDLDTQKLRKLGWKWNFDLKEMFLRMAQTQTI